VRWTNAVLPRGHRSVQRVIWLVQIWSNGTSQITQYPLHAPIQL
jgi:hypothetical protein